MKPQISTDLPTDDLFRNRLGNLIDRRHELVKLAAVMDWQRFDNEWGEAFCEHGRPAIATLPIAGLHYLEHTYGLSDEQVVQRWSENPYWQYFCGETYQPGGGRAISAGQTARRSHAQTSLTTS